MAVPTANVWAKTQLLLHSLAAMSDDFQLMVSCVSIHNLMPAALVIGTCAGVMHVNLAASSARCQR